MTTDHLPDAILAPANPGNYGPRRNVPIDLVVVHCTEGPFHSALVWFADKRAGSSAHYVVSRSGVVAQCVPEGDAAWHAGNSVYNKRSIGVELEGYAGQASSFPADSVLIHTAAELVANVCARHRIPIDRDHVIAHAEVPHPHDPSRRGGVHGHIDPGPHFPWDDFMRLVHGLASSDATPQPIAGATTSTPQPTQGATDGFPSV